MVGTAKPKSSGKKPKKKRKASSLVTPMTRSKKKKKAAAKTAKKKTPKKASPKNKAPRKVREKRDAVAMFFNDGSDAEILTTGDIAGILKVSSPTVIKLIDKGDIKSYKLPGLTRQSRRVRVSDLREFIKEKGFPLKRIHSGVVLTASDIAEAAKTCHFSVTRWLSNGFVKNFEYILGHKLVFLEDAVKFFEEHKIPTDILDEVADRRRKSSKIWNTKPGKRKNVKTK
jgi:excisionase family DNA binding protein